MTGAGRLSLALVLTSLMLAGCTGDDAPQAASTSTPTPTADAAPTPRVTPSGISLPPEVPPTPSPTTSGPPAQPRAADVEVVTVAVDRGRVAPDERFVVTVRLHNAGDLAGEGSVTLLFDGEGMETETFLVEGGATVNLSFPLTSAEAGTHEVWVQATGARVDATAILVEVVSAGAFVLSALQISPPALELGDVAVVTVTVANEGATPASGTVRVDHLGEGLTSRAVELAPGASQTLTLQARPTRGSTEPLTVRVLSSTASISGPLTVRAPVIANATGVFNQGMCDNYLGYAVQFDNAGNGVARQVTAKATVTDANGTFVSEYTSSPPIDVGAKQHGSMSVAPTITQRCGKDDTYSIHVVVTPLYGEAVEFDAGPFVV